MTVLAHPVAPVKTQVDWLCVFTAIHDRVARQVAHFSELYELSPIDLKLRVLLHLPRYRYEELENDELLSAEIERLAAKTRELQRGFENWAKQEPIGCLDRTKAYVGEVSEGTATIIHGKFHYIGAVRSGRHFALYFAGHEMPAAVATLSDMDVKKLRPYLPVSEGARNLILSRMFSFRWAPPNSISYLLGAIGRCLRREGKVESLVTWVNPNLGFRASSYRAANWTYLGEEPTTYHYQEGNYLTARQLFQMSRAMPFGIDASQLRLEPLQVWYRNVTWTRQ